MRTTIKKVKYQTIQYNFIRGQKVNDETVMCRALLIREIGGGGDGGGGGVGVGVGSGGDGDWL